MSLVLSEKYMSVNSVSWPARCFMFTNLLFPLKFFFCEGKGKGCLSMRWRHIGGVEVYFHLFVTLEVLGLNDQLHAPATFSLYPLNVRWALERVWFFWFLENRKLFCLYWDTNRGPSIVLGIATTLVRLSGSYKHHEDVHAYSLTANA